ncbi:MAG: hypothetical protein V3T83_06410, partial [Acidobacteriota bacterium]
ADFGIRLNNANGTTVHRIFSDGSTEVFATGLAGASGNDFDSQGNLYQSNIAGGRISKITSEGIVTTFATANIIGPVGVAVDGQDTVFVANCGGNSIARVTPQGNSTIFSSSPFLSCPNGLTIDQDGNLYTSNFNNGWVIRITPQGSASQFAFIPGNGNGHITYANGLLYAVGRSANQIFTVTLAGEVTLLAGAGPLGAGPRGNDDGPALEATFSVPNGVRASPDGDTLYINSAVPLVNPDLNPVVVRAIRGLRGLSTALHFPQFGNGDGFGSGLVIYNPSASSPISGDVAFWDQDGAPIAPFAILQGSPGPDGSISNLRFDLPPLGSITFPTTGQGELVLGSAFVQATSTVSGVVRFEIPGVGIAGVGSAQPAAALMAPARREGDIRTGVAVRNVGSDAIEVEISLKNTSGEVVPGGTGMLKIAGRGRVAAFIEELFPDAGSADFQGSICLRATTGEIAVIALEMGGQPGEFTTLPVSVIEE